jgi:predicted amidohydrolase
MLNIGIAQIKNSIDVQTNFDSIWRFLDLFKSNHVDLILFPECALSGFSASIKNCSLDSLESYLSKISDWAFESGIDVVLPTAIMDGKIYNSGFIFTSDKRVQFHKLGLTESEKQFFSTPEIESKKKFHCKNYSYGLLICMEAQQEPWRYFSNSEVDFILWPGYWGWDEKDQWTPQNEENLVFKNSIEWRKPLIQSNFAFNDSGDLRKGPKGLSVVIDQSNQLAFRGSHESESGFIVTLKKTNLQTIVTRVSSLY